VLNVDGRLTSRPGCFTLRKRGYCTVAGLAPGTVCTGTENISFTFYPRNVQLVANRYTDWANTAHKWDRYREWMSENGEALYKQI